METVSQQLVQAREMRKLNIEQLSEKTGIPLETITNIEAGELDPNASTLLRICKELNCTIVLGDSCI